MSVQPILWTDKYRPLVPDEYVGHKDIVIDVMKYVKHPETMPNLAFEGGAGIGKTTLALMFVHALGDRVEVREFNSDVDKNQAFVEKLKREVSTPPVKAVIRLIILDEVSEMSRKAQTSLRSLLEIDYPWNKFILIYNYPTKMVSSLVNRPVVFHFRNLEVEDIIISLDRVIDGEGLIPQIDATKIIAMRSNGSGRRAINLLQKYTRNKYVAPPIDDEDDSVTVMFNSIWDANMDDAWNTYLIYDRKGRYIEELPQMFINVVEKKFSKHYGMKALLSRHIIQLARDMATGINNDVCMYGFFGSVFAIAVKQQGKK